MRRRFTAPAVVSLSVFSMAALGLLGPAAGPASAATCNGYVALTYDDGPTNMTQQYLNALKSANARATFFIWGQRAQSNQAGLKAISDAGMWLGNHSWSHGHLAQASNAQSELSQTQNIIQQVTGKTPQVFRPPYGETGQPLKNAEAALGLKEIIWDVDTGDWNNASTDQIVQKATSASNGQVVLMHDGYSSTLNAVGRIVSGLASKNLCPGMISPSTGRAVAPDGAATSTPVTSTPVTSTPVTSPVTPSTPVTTAGGTGGCTATFAVAETWGDRFNGTITVSGASNWTVTATLGANQNVINSWNATVSGTSGVVTATSNGNGNSFGITIQDQGNNRTQPTLSCSGS